MKIFKWINFAMLYLALSAAPAWAYPTIERQPQDQSAEMGQDVIWNVVARGRNLTYQWYKVGVGPLPAAADWQFGISRVNPSHEGVYFVEVSDRQGTVRSRNFRLNVRRSGGHLDCQYQPYIMTPPESLTVQRGESPIFRVYASGENLKYEWSRLGTAPFPGAADWQFGLSGVTWSDEGQYMVRVFNNCGEDYSYFNLYVR